MLRKAIALIALAAATVIVGPAAAAPASAAPVCGQPMEPPCIPTKTHISVDAAGPGEPIELTVSASANYPTPPEGDIAVTVIAGNGGAGQSLGARAAAPLFRTTVHFVDDAVVINGPALPRGDYIATAAFTPDNGNLFLPSDARTAFRIGAAGGPGDGDDGTLPNTGGPNMMWLLLGSGLVLAGAGGVGLGRRRQTVDA